MNESTAAPRALAVGAVPWAGNVGVLNVTPGTYGSSVAKVPGTWQRSIMARVSSRRRRVRFLSVLTEVPVNSTARMMKR